MEKLCQTERKKTYFDISIHVREFLISFRYYNSISIYISYFTVFSRAIGRAAAVINSWPAHNIASTDCVER